LLLAHHASLGSDPQINLIKRMANDNPLLGAPRIHGEMLKLREVFTVFVSALGIDPILTAYRSPWQNGYCEMLIGSIRSECLDHVIIFNESHLQGILQEYIRYYNAQRTHLGINKEQLNRERSKPTAIAGRPAITARACTHQISSGL
jgi:hypothetical protein